MPLFTCCVIGPVNGEPLFSDLILQVKLKDIALHGWIAGSALNQHNAKQLIARFR